MFERPGEPRHSYQALLTALQPLDPSGLRYRADQMARAFTDRSVTFDHAGLERPFPLDLIPRIIDAAEWDHISRGVAGDDQHCSLAWVEYWDGEWVACDPTNLAHVGERHVVVAAGRDYGDVPPLKGIYRGAPNSRMQVAVSVTRRA